MLAVIALASVVCGGLALAGASRAPATPVGRLTVYVGTYTSGGSRGIYRFELDLDSGAATDPVLAVESENPSFLALHPNGRVLYAVNEVATSGGAPTGAVSAFAIDSSSGALSLLNRQASRGTDPCHLIVDRAGRHLLVANYSSGNVAVLPLAADGRLLTASSVRQHAGTGPNPDRQKGPHAHTVTFDAAERFAFAADLGADRIFVNRFDAATGRLEPHDPDAAVLEPGSGPRHLAWHPSGQYLYAINELRSTVTVLFYDAGRGALTAAQTISTLPAGFAGQNTAAEVVVPANGRFLYASNRGHDSLAMFAIDPTSGTLTPNGHVSAGGRTPRHFAIDSGFRWLLAANQDSDSIVAFRLDPATGRPTPAGRPVTISKPVCVLFAPTPL